MGLTEKQAAARTQSHPDDPKGWKSLGAHFLESGRQADARSALERALQVAPGDAEAMRIMADLLLKEGKLEEARRQLDNALELDPDHLLGQIKLSEILHRLGRNEEALQRLDKIGCPAAAHRAAWLSWHGVILLAMQRYDEARRDFEAQIEIEPKEYSVWNNLGNVHRDTGDLDQAERCYTKAAQLTKTDPLPRSNRLTSMHYHPAASAEDILQACRDWGGMFAPAVRPERPIPKDRSPSRVIRIGMFSDGFRQHPVGTMTVSALEHLSRFGYEIYAYTTSNSVDAITQRFMALARKWTPIYHLTDEQFAARIREDEVDILIDLSGHNAGSRIRAMAMEPAPILVKWVGGLINTTGVEAIDYLISDRVESPAGSDHLYTEKLIRMPDDYICFVPPASPPELAPLPALRNGYITFGCFNNPTKINKTLLSRWAELLHAVPQSRLFLKGAAYATRELRQRVVNTLAEHGIGEDRLRIEGRSPHLELLARYNEVDIALDPWPYSGGLTTCEAMLMGVPVVTLPGPTFAGRHSATHLANVGMPELVADDWGQYRARVLELASDLDSLSTIRAHLRRILLESPVCDAPRFARHLANALRAIWQRYCQDKPPAALAFTTDSQPWFEGEDAPTDLVNAGQHEHEAESNFHFSFQGQVVMLDHGGCQISDNRFKRLSKLGALTIIVIDPSNSLKEADKLRHEGCLQHYHANVALGDGQPGTLYICLEAGLTGTLEPLPKERLASWPGLNPSILGKIPIPTARLEAIEGLERIDWLVLDDTHDNLAILRSAGKLLQNMLVIQVRIRFADTFAQQPDLADITRLLSERGFRLLRLDKAGYASYFPASTRKGEYAGAQLLSADAIFVAAPARMKQMSDNQRLQLAFILHAGYGVPDLAYHALAINSHDTAQRYLESTGWAEPARETGSAPHGTGTARKRFVHICYNNMHIQGMLPMLAELSAQSDFSHQIFIERSRSVANYDNDLSSNSNAEFFDKHADADRIRAACLAGDVAGVYIHGMFFDWQKQLVTDIGATKKVIWVLWGGDLYNPIREQNPLTGVINRIHAIATGTDGDYQLFCQAYGEKPRLQFAYPAVADFSSIPVPASKSKRIVVGNSGDPGNMHAEILDNLARKTDIQGYEIILPAAYNLSAPYRQALDQRIAVFGKDCRIRLLTEFMPTSNYFAMLADAQFFITAHHRQQAMGNLVASLYFGNTTVLRRDITVNNSTRPNPSWGLLTEKMDTIPLSYEEFSTISSLSEIPALASKSLKNQQRSILQYYGTEGVKKILEQQFSVAAML